MVLSGINIEIPANTDQKYTTELTELKNAESKILGIILADDLEDIGGSVRTIVKYRDHHLSGGKQFPIVQAVVKRNNPPTYGPYDDETKDGEYWPGDHDGGEGYPNPPVKEMLLHQVNHYN